MARTVTVIPASVHKFTAMPLSSNIKKRVAAYARVSTDLEEQLSSYEAQVDYYTKYIQNNPEWEFVSVYTDEGISATSTRHRDGFNRMITDALEGKIDMIITKSVSRFARNTVDTLTTVRKLKEKGIEVYFEKENIYTLDSKGELLITIMSSLAQEESRSISENVTWGQRKRFADGKVSMPYKQFLGYDKGKNKNDPPVINEEQAETVKLIYRLFLEGKTPGGIAKHLMSQGIPSPAGKEHWQSGTVYSILTNEKYTGDALLQKKYTVDFLTKKQKVNEGEVPQYYVENSHPAIISHEVFDMVQQEIKRRKDSPTRHSGVGLFGSRIICGDCGAAYGAKVWHSTDKYRKVIYQCNHKFHGEKCTTPKLEEEEIKSMFVTTLNRLIQCRDEVIANFEAAKEVLFDTSCFASEKAELHDEMTVTAELIQKCVDENAHTAVNQDKYQKRYEALVNRFEKAKSKLQEIDETINDREARRLQTELFIRELKKQDCLITEFDEKLWFTLMDYITVYSADDIRFTFKNGTEIKV